MSKKQSRKTVRTIRYRILDDVLPLAEQTVKLYRSAASHCLSVLKENTELLRVKDDPKEAPAGKYDLFITVERLIHRTRGNPDPAYPLDAVGRNIPAYCRRSAINSAIGTARSWHANYENWASRGEKKHPPALHTENSKWPVLYKGIYKEFKGKSVLLKLYTGKAWVWRKVLISTTTDIPENSKEQSMALVVKGGRCYLHRTVEYKTEKRRAVRDKVITIDLNIDRTVVMAAVGRDGRIYGVEFIDTRKDNRRRKFYLEAITRKQSETGVIKEDEVFCKDLWQKVRCFNEDMSHKLSRRIVDFAGQHGCTTIVFEHLGKLGPKKGTRSARLNLKLMYWLKGSIYGKTSYKAKGEGMWATRVNPFLTSQACSRHQNIFDLRNAVRVKRSIQSRIECTVCGYKADADFNACVNIARKYFSRESELKALGGNVEACHEAIRFLSRCMDPLFVVPGNNGNRMDVATPHMSELFPYPGQPEVLRSN